MGGLALLLSLVKQGSYSQDQRLLALQNKLEENSQNNML